MPLSVFGSGTLEVVEMPLPDGGEKGKTTALFGHRGRQFKL